MTFRPLLGEKLGDFRKRPGATVEGDLLKLRYPLFASFKLDGWRGGWETLEFMSRSRKTIPNRQLQRLAREAGVPSGYDGEIIVGEPFGPGVFARTDKFCKTALAVTDLPVRFFVFDNYEASGSFAQRWETLQDISSFVVKLDQILCDRPDDVLALEAKALEIGYEGLVLRAPDGKYKQGRSTLREQYLLKVKRFIEIQATCVGFKEKLHNANEATTSETGYAKRSSHKENKIPMGTLGSIQGELATGQPVSVGSGFSDEERRKIWANRESYLGEPFVLKSFPIGVKDAPRQPTFIRWGRL